MVREKYKGREGRDEEHQMNYWNKQRKRRMEDHTDAKEN